MSARRNYYIIVRIHKSTDRPGSADGPVVAGAVKRARLGIFQVNKWRAIAAKMVADLGYEMGSPFGRHDIREWQFMAFVYGSFSPEGMGRCGSTLVRLPARKAI